MTTVPIDVKVDSSGAKSGAKGVTRSFNSIMSKAKQTDRATSKLNRSLKDTATVTNQLGKSVRSFAIFSSAIASTTLVIKNSVAQAIKYRTALAEVNTLVGDTFNFQKLKEGVREVSLEFGKMPTEQAKAAYQIISAGASSAAEALDILSASNKLAIGGVTQVSVAADGLTSILNAYGDGVKGATEVSDALFVAMKGGKTTIGELSAAIGKVAPIAAQTNVSLDELLASISALTKGGIATTEAVTGVRAILAAVAKPTKEATDLAKELGIEFSASALKAKGFAAFLQELKEKTGSNTESMAQLFGGVEALIPILALTGKSSKDFSKILDDMGKKVGETGEAFEKMASTPEQAINRLKVRFVDLSISIGDSVTDRMLPAIKALTENFDAMVVVLIGGIGGIGVALALIFPQITAVTVGVLAAVAAFELLRDTFPAIDDAFKGLIHDLNEVTNPLKALNALWIVGIGEMAKFALSVKNLGSAILTAIVEPFKKIARIFSAFWQDLTSLANPFGGSGFSNKLERELQTGFVDEFTGAFQKVRSEGEVFDNLIDSWVDGKLVELSDSATQVAKSVGSGDKDSISGSLEVASKSVNELGEDFEGLDKIFKGVGRTIKDSFNDLFKGLFSKGKFEFDDFLDNMLSGFSQTLANMATMAISKPVIVPMVGTVSGMFGNQDTALAGLSSQGAGGFGDISSLFGAAKSLFSGGSGLLFNSGAANAVNQFLGGQGANFIGPAAPTALGNAAGNLGSVGGAAGAFGGNLLANSLFGDRGAGANIGGTIGSVVGSFIPVPILGPAIGSFIGNTIGGLFGNKKPSDKMQLGFVDLGSGELFDRQGLGGVDPNNPGKKFSKENFDAVTRFAALAKQISDAVGGTGNVRFDIGDRDGLRLKFAQNAADLNLSHDVRSFGQDKSAFTEALVEGIVISGTEISDSIKDSIINNVDFSDLDRALGDVDFIIGFEKLFEGSQPVLSQMEVAVKNLDVAYKQSLSTVKRLGLSEEKLDKMRAKANKNLKDSFTKSIQNQILSITDPTTLGLQQLNDIQTQRRRDAVALGVDLLEIERLFALEREKIMQESLTRQSNTLESALARQAKQQIENIERIQRELAFSKDFSGTNRFGRAQEADLQLETLLNRVRSGDKDVFDDLDSIINQSLGAALDYYGSTENFLERLSLVDIILEESKSLAKSSLTKEEQSLLNQMMHADISQQILDETRRQSEILNTQLTSVSSDVREFNALDKLKLLNTGESLSRLNEINPNNNIADIFIRGAKSIASGGAFDFTKSEFGVDGGGISFADFVRGSSQGEQIQSRYNDIVEAFGGSPQFFTSDASEGVTQDTVVDLRGPGAVDSAESRVVSREQSGTSQSGSSVREVTSNMVQAIDDSFGKFARQSSEETDTTSQLLKAVLRQLEEINDNVSLSSLSGIGGTNS